jgi:DNA-binding response OmpR family regulator
MADNNRLLMVDDDVDLVESIRQYLVPEGFEVAVAYAYAPGLAAALSGDNDLVLLDIMLPGGSGFDLLRELRAKSSVPVLLLSACGDAGERVTGLEIGADDYVTKPFDPQELVARVRAILRRARCPDEDGGWIKVGTLSLSPGQRKATCSNNELALTSVEFNVLECLLRHRGRVVPREELVRVALGRRVGLLDRSIDVHISRVRRKLEECGATDVRIQAVRGMGYLYAASSTDVAA